MAGSAGCSAEQQAVASLHLDLSVSWWSWFVLKAVADACTWVRAREPVALHFAVVVAHRPGVARGSPPVGLM